MCPFASGLACSQVWAGGRGGDGPDSLPTLPGVRAEAIPMMCFWNSEILKLNNREVYMPFSPFYYFKVLECNKSQNPCLDSDIFFSFFFWSQHLSPC